MAVSGSYSTDISASHASNVPGQVPVSSARLLAFYSSADVDVIGHYYSIA